MTFVNSAGVKLVVLAIFITGLINNYKVAVKEWSNITLVVVIFIRIHLLNIWSFTAGDS